MNLLFMVPYVPNLVRVRPYNLLRSLAARGHAITLLTLSTSPEELDGVRCLQDWGVQVEAGHLPRLRSLTNSLLALPTQTPLQSVYCWQPALASRLEDLVRARRFDVAHVEHLRGARYGLAVQRASHGKLPVVWDSVDSISMLFRQAASHSKSLFGRLLSRLELGRTERFEPWLAHQFDHVLVTSENDRQAFTRLDPATGDRISVLPNGVDLDYFTLAPGLPRQPDTIVISGKMSYHANVAMALYLVTEILPKIHSRRPEVKVLVVGKDPPREVQALAANPAVVVTGTVPDIRPYLQSAAVAAVPLTYGAGIQNKVLEAMASGTPVVSTPQAVSALQVVHGQDLLVAADPEAFAASVLCLLDNASRRQEVGEAGRRYVETHHRWEVIASHLEEIYQQVAFG